MMRCMSGRLRRAWLGGLAAALVVVVVALAGVGVGAAIPGLSGDRADRGEVTTTRDYPFFNASAGRYENLGSFGVGQRLSSARGGKPSFRGFVAGSSHITTAYNLTVAVDHTYHVGRQQILVHNTEGPCDVATGEAANGVPKALPSGPKITAQWGADTYRHGGLMSTIEHINYRHAYNSGFSGVSRYAQGTSARDIKGYVDYVLRNGTVTDRGMVGNVGRTIGYDRVGNPVSGLEIIVRDGMIKTAYPVGVP